MITPPPWRTEEHDQLRAMAAAGESIVAIARQLKRSTAAVRKRGSRTQDQVGPFAVRSQGKTKMKLGPPKGRPRTPAEDAQLLALLASKLDKVLIAPKLKRTVSAIHSRKKHPDGQAE
jgi:hypothetical protein